MVNPGPKRPLIACLALSLLAWGGDAMGATLDIVAGALTYTAGSGVNNVLTISVAAGNYTFSDTAETITLGAGATGAGWAGSGTNTVTGTDASVSSIAVVSGDGNDTIDVQSANDPVTVAGGSGDDTLVVEGIPGALDNLRHVPTGLGAGRVVNDSAPLTVTFTGIEHIRLVLQLADGDGVRVDGTVGNDRFQFFHGAVLNSGIFRGTMDQNNATGGGPFALTETTYTGGNALLNDSDVNFFVPGGTDSVEFNGTSGDDVIDVGNGEAGGTEVRNTIGGVVYSRLEIFNVTSVSVLGAGGSDTFNVVPRTSVTVNVVGGAPTPPIFPGDQMHLNPAGTTGLVSTAAGGPSGLTGSFTFTNRATVTFSELEFFDPWPPTAGADAVIPTLSHWGMALLGLLLGFAGLRGLRHSA